jgi:hypothetical protein
MSKHPLSDFLKFIGTPFQRYILPVAPVNAVLSEDSSLVAEQLGKIPGSWSARRRLRWPLDDNYDGRLGPLRLD